MAWDDTKKEKAVKMYQEQNPTPDSSVEIVKEIAEDIGETPNGVRMILSKAGVYVKSTQTTSSTGKKKEDAEKTPKVGKADKIARLSTAIESAGMIPDNEILEKLTGKAADYFAQVVEALVTAATASDDA
jgi:predicted transcriptional regulator